MKQGRLAGLVLAGALCCAAGQAAAQELGFPGAWLGGDNAFYLGAGYRGRTGDGYRWSTLPRRDAPNGNPAPGSVLNFDTGNDLHGFSGHLGYVLPDEIVPAWLGSNLRVEFAGAWSRGASTSSRDEAPTRAFAVLPLDGSLVIANNAFPVRYAGQQRVSQENTDFRFTLATDVRLTRRWILTPSIYLHYAETDTRIDTDYVADQILFPGLVFPVNIRETLMTDTLGGGAGLQVTFRPRPDLALFAGGTVGMAHMRAEYRGADCFGTIPVPAPCNNFITSRVRSKRERTGLTAGVSGGLSVRFLERFVFSALGYARYDRNGLSVRYPTEVNRRPASLQLRDRWVFGARVMLTVPMYLGGP